MEKERLPPLPIRRPVRWVDDVRYHWRYTGPEVCGGGEDTELYARVESVREHFTRARLFIETGNFPAARQHLERYLRESASLLRDGVDGAYPEPLQQQRNDAIDLLDVVREHDRGVSASPIKAYAEVRLRDAKSIERPDAWLELARRSAPDDRFADNVA